MKVIISFSKDFSNIKDTTGLNILRPKKLPDKIMEPKSKQVIEKTTTVNQKKCTLRPLPNHEKRETLTQTNFKNQMIQISWSKPS